MRVAVRAAGINFPDILMVAGEYQFKPDLPFTPGMEAAGDVIEVGSARVGLLGVVMNDPSVYRGVPFGSHGLENPNEVVLRESEKLLATCTAVIPITHQSMDDDRALAASSRFPVIVGGHEHVPLLEQVASTFIVKVGMDAERASVIDLVWPEVPGLAVIPVTTITLEPVVDHAEDPAMRARVDGHLAKVHELETSTLFTLAPGQTLSSVGTRRQQTTLGSLVCSIIRDTLLADAALFNGGGIRACNACQ